MCFQFVPALSSSCYFAVSVVAVGFFPSCFITHQRRNSAFHCFKIASSHLLADLLIRRFSLGNADILCGFMIVRKHFVTKCEKNKGVGFLFSCTNLGLCDQNAAILFSAGHILILLIWDQLQAPHCVCPGTHTQKEHRRRHKNSYSVPLLLLLGSMFLFFFNLIFSAEHCKSNVMLRCIQLECYNNTNYNINNT